MSDISWTQLSLIPSEAVTHVVVEVGMVADQHCQWQITARDETGALVSMVSRWSADLSDLQLACSNILAELTKLRNDRHAPF